MIKPYMSHYANGEAVDAALDSGVAAQSEVSKARSSYVDLNARLSALQGEIDQIVISASAEAVVAPEVAAARVDANGNEFTTLKERIDSDQNRSLQIEDEIDFLYDAEEVEYTTRVNFIINSQGEFVNINGYGVAQFAIEAGCVYKISGENLDNLRIGFVDSIPSAGVTVSGLKNINGNYYIFVNGTTYAYCLVNKYSLDDPDGDLVITKLTPKTDDIIDDIDDLSDNIDEVEASVEMLADDIYTDSIVDYTTRVNFIINSQGKFANIDGYGVAQFPLEAGCTYEIEAENISEIRIGFTDTIPSTNDTVSDIVTIADNHYTFKNDTNYAYCLINKYTLAEPNGTLTITKKTSKIANVESEIEVINDEIETINDALFITRDVDYTTRVNFIINSQGEFISINGYGVAQFPITKGCKYEITISDFTGIRLGFVNEVPSSNDTVYDVVNITSNTYSFTNDTDYAYCLINKYSLAEPDGDVSVVETKPKEIDINTSNPSNIVYVAASDSAAHDIAIADFTCDGEHDEIEIQQAIDSLTNGGTVYLLDGTYNIDGWNHTYNSTNDQGDPRKIAFALGITTERNQQNIRICGMNTPIRQYGGKVPKCTACINVTSAALDALDSGSYNVGNVIGCIGYKGTDRLYPKYGLEVDNLGFLIADNQHPVTVINGEMFSELCIDNVMITPFQTGGTDTPFPVAASGMVGVRGLLGSNSGKNYIIKRTFVFGMNIGFDMNGEHLIMEQCGVRFSVIPYRFGNWNKYGANTHDQTLINCCHEMCINGIVFDGFTNYQSINLYDYNIEKLLTGTYAQVSKATDNTGGKGRGNIFYTVCDNTFINIEDTFFETGGTGFNCVNTTMRRSGTTANRPSVGNHLQQYFNTDLMRIEVFYNGEWH